jgi:decaprenylphospho-beta-D-erythro-pentofuranosid-2-ulose 2-reductase
VSEKRAIVVGASSGIGAALVERLVEQGWTVAAVARREDRLRSTAEKHSGKVLPFPHDVTNYAEAPRLFQEITKQLGGLDMIIYASGAMPPVDLEEYDFDKDRQMIEVNVLGAIAWLNQAAMRFGAAGHGTIVGIGSVAGDRGRRGQPVYNASKACLATYLEALRNRLARKGVTVVTVKPGPVKTEMTQHLALNRALTAEQAADLILKKASRSGEHYLALPHRVIFAVIRLLPSWIMRRLKL